MPAGESVFLWTPPALAVTDLIANGALAKHPDLRIGIVGLSSIWVMYLMMLDGGLDFVATLNGQPLAELDMKPSAGQRRAAVPRQRRVPAAYRLITQGLARFRRSS